MYSAPYMFFHRSKGYSWHAETDPALQAFPTLNNVPRALLPSLAINVSQPDALMEWLGTNSAALITDLTIFVDAVDIAPSAQKWCILFEKLAQDATNIQNLSIYWDSEGPIHIGLGRSVVFVRGVARLKVKKSIDIAGFYATKWPRYLEAKMGLKPVNRQLAPGNNWAEILRKYQRGTEHLDPWKDTEDGMFDIPIPWPGLKLPPGLDGC
ncbi:hypothetical protein B0J11DRAFT_541288 [Dendryphion nanum]|uniref:Uncharacterized protein n=1 Tax=Dendryphion nanum TaxID=256645 RepID=A0A9P9D6R4_9PLEO|nr:hypothetical protein B0J11DRAFT_541288 [Dendryphion nanum]